MNRSWIAMIVRRITTDIHSVSEESHLSLMAVKSAHLSLRACDPLFLPLPPLSLHLPPAALGSGSASTNSSSGQQSRAAQHSHHGGPHRAKWPYDKYYSPRHELCSSVSARSHGGLPHRISSPTPSWAHQSAACTVNCPEQILESGTCNALNQTVRIQPVI